MIIIITNTTIIIITVIIITVTIIISFHLSSFLLFIFSTVSENSTDRQTHWAKTELNLPLFEERIKKRKEGKKTREKIR